MLPTGSHNRILQIHPLRRCNLFCLHCYSSSGPYEDDVLDEDLLSQVIMDAKDKGYNVISISGGEPFLYKPLSRLVALAHELDMVTTVTTNGMLMNPDSLLQLQGVIDLLAISLDGIPESHNRMRNNKHAFQRMSSNLEYIRTARIPFGFIFTLTQHNLNELKWVAEFAIEQGAKLLQIHPLEIAGRAQEELLNKDPDDIEASFAFLEMLRIQAQAESKLHVHLDLSNKKDVIENPGKVYVSSDSDNTGAQSKLVSPLIIEPDGTVVPIRYGFSREFALGNIKTKRLSEQLDTWKADGYNRFLGLCEKLYDEVISTDAPPLFNWYEKLANLSNNVPTK